MIPGDLGLWSGVRKYTTKVIQQGIIGSEPERVALSGYKYIHLNPEPSALARESPSGLSSSICTSRKSKLVPQCLWAFRPKHAKAMKLEYVTPLPTKT